MNKQQRYAIISLIFVAVITLIVVILYIFVLPKSGSHLLSTNDLISSATLDSKWLGGNEHGYIYFVDNKQLISGEYLILNKFDISQKKSPTLNLSIDLRNNILNRHERINITNLCESNSDSVLKNFQTDFVIAFEGSNKIWLFDDKSLLKPVIVDSMLIADELKQNSTKDLELDQYSLNYYDGLKNRDSIFFIYYIKKGLRVFHRGLLTLNISNPCDPVVAATLPIKRNLNNVCNYMAYYANHSIFMIEGNRITIINVSNISKPKIETEYFSKDGQGYYNIYVDNDLAYVATCHLKSSDNSKRGSKVLILNISNYNNIEILGEYYVSAPPYTRNYIVNIFTLNEYAFITGSRDIHIIDVSNLSSPFLIKKYDPSGGFIENSYVDNKYIYIINTVNIEEGVDRFHIIDYDFRDNYN